MHTLGYASLSPLLPPGVAVPSQVRPALGRRCQALREGGGVPSQVHAADQGRPRRTAQQVPQTVPTAGQRSGLQPHVGRQRSREMPYRRWHEPGLRQKLSGQRQGNGSQEGAKQAVGRELRPPSFWWMERQAAQMGTCPAEAGAPLPGVLGEGVLPHRAASACPPASLPSLHLTPLPQLSGVPFAGKKSTPTSRAVRGTAGWSTQLNGQVTRGTPTGSQTSPFIERQREGTKLQPATSISPGTNSRATSQTVNPDAEGQCGPCVLSREGGVATHRPPRECHRRP